MPRKKKEENEEVKTTKKKARRKKKASKKKSTKKKTTKKKTGRRRGRPRKSETTSIEEDTLEQKENMPKQSSIIRADEKPTQWILTKEMQFGLINEGFSVGTIFTVDWANKVMRCESNGEVYNNVKDLEIAARIGAAEPYGEESQAYEQQQVIEQEKKAAQLRRHIETRDEKDQRVRNMIDRSDQDIVQSIDISHTHKAKPRKEAPINVTPTSEVSVMKPTEKREMEVHYSDSPQQGQIVRSSNPSPLMREEVRTRTATGKPLSPVLAGQKSWDIKKSGQIQNEIRQKIADTSIKVDENGQQYIRGLPVIRDDSEVSGPSLNEGLVTSVSKEERSQRIQQIRSEKHADVGKRRSKSGNNAPIADPQVNNPNLETIMPQEVVPGMGVSDQGVEPIERIEPPAPKDPPKSNAASKLLRRRK